MIELAYRCTVPNHHDKTYTLVQYDANGPVQFLIDGTNAGKIEKQDGIWHQIEGDEIEGDILKEMGAFLDQHPQSNSSVEF